MDVTKSNFDERLLNEIKDSVESCSFISIDCEFSGLHADSNSSPLDTPSERYSQSIRPSIKQFIAFQFGLSIFSPGSSPGVFKNRSYNFYVWQGNSAPSNDLRFLCQSSSIDFLASQNFDFNKLFREGIPYIRLSDASILRQSLIEKQNIKVDYPPIAIPNHQKDFLKDIHQRISVFLQNEGNEEPLELPICNTFQRKLIYQTVQETFGNEVYVGTNKKRMTLVHKLSTKERNQNLELEEFDRSLGFSKVIRIISNSKKPLVGHNMMLDLCFTLHQFVAPLPEMYTDFKDLAMETFPEIYDTKVLASMAPVKDHIPNSTLEDLRNRLKENPFKVPAIESRDEKYRKGGMYHEAGFDAYVTGLCFLGMKDFLISQMPSSNKEKILIMKPFSNKIAITRINDVPYLNIGGEDISPDRSHVFYVTFPTIWKTTDLNSLFSTFGNVQISWLTDNSAYVSLYQKELSGSVMDSLNCSSVYSITPYDKHKSRSIPTSITPLLEKSDIFSKSISSASNSTKKRAVSPNGILASTLKRSKSRTEETSSPPIFPESTTWD